MSRARLRARWPAPARCASVTRFPAVPRGPRSSRSSDVWRPVGSTIGRARLGQPGVDEVERLLHLERALEAERLRRQPEEGLEHRPGEGDRLGSRERVLDPPRGRIVARGGLVDRIEKTLTSGSFTSAIRASGRSTRPPGPRTGEGRGRDRRPAGGPLALTGVGNRRRGERMRRLPALVVGLVLPRPGA